MAKLGIEQTEGEIVQMMGQLIADESSRVFKRAMPSILLGIREDIVAELKQTTEYEMIMSIWRGDFGFERGTEYQRLEAIIQTIANSVNIEFEDFVCNRRGNISGGLTIGILIADYSDILPLKQAYVDNLANIPMRIPWLEWLLKKGGRIPYQVAGYHIIFGAEGSKRNKNSRSGIAIMAKGGAWRVPGDGTQNDNWLTRFVTSDIFLAELEDRIDRAISE